MRDIPTNRGCIGSLTNKDEEETDQMAPKFRIYLLIEDDQHHTHQGHAKQGVQAKVKIQA